MLLDLHTGFSRGRCDSLPGTRNKVEYDRALSSRHPWPRGLTDQSAPYSTVVSPYPVCVSVVSNLRNPLDCSLPGSSVYGTFQAGILKWVAIPSSWGPSWPQLEPASPLAPALQADSLPTEPSGKPPWPLRAHQLAGQNCCQQINSQVGAFTCQKTKSSGVQTASLNTGYSFSKATS